MQRRAGNPNPIANLIFSPSIQLLSGKGLHLFQTRRQNILFFSTKRSKSLHKAKQTESAEKTHPFGSHIHFHAYKCYSYDVLTYTKI